MRIWDRGVGCIWRRVGSGLLLLRGVDRLGGLGEGKGCDCGDGKTLRC